MKSPQKRIEDLRIELDSIIKEVDYGQSCDCFDYLVKAKDNMGYAIFELQMTDEQ